MPKECNLKSEIEKFLKIIEPQEVIMNLFDLFDESQIRSRTGDSYTEFNYFEKLANKSMNLCEEIEYAKLMIDQQLSELLKESTQEKKKEHLFIYKYFYNDCAYRYYNLQEMIVQLLGSYYDVSDSKLFKDSFNKISKNFPENIKNICKEFNTLDIIKYRSGMTHTVVPSMEEEVIDGMTLLKRNKISMLSKEMIIRADKDFSEIISKLCDSIKEDKTY